jgi:hypothetical protein
MSNGVRVDEFLLDHERLTRGVTRANPEMALMLLMWQTPTDRALSGWTPYPGIILDAASESWLTSACSDRPDDFAGGGLA